MDKNRLETLFEIEPVEDPPCDHGCPALVEGWQELVSEVERWDDAPTDGYALAAPWFKP